MGEGVGMEEGRSEGGSGERREAESLCDYTGVRLKAIYMKRHNNTQPNLMMHYTSHSIEIRNTEDQDT